MTEPERFASLERQVGDLRVSVGKLEKTAEHLQATTELQQESMGKLSASIEGLTAVLNQGKGAARLLVGVATLGGTGLGAILMALAKKYGLF